MKHTHAATGWVLQYSKPAALLAAIAAVWSVVHPSSRHLLQCMAVAAQLNAGYNQTQRNAALGVIPQGILFSLTVFVNL